MLIAEKGTMGVGSSRMSGVNNVALWTGKKASPCSFYKYCSIVAGTNGFLNFLDYGRCYRWNRFRPSKLGESSG
jgi:aconitase B